jgi:non-homologous end joining protein Ku
VCSLSSEGFEPESYRDEYRDRVLAMIDEKVKGQELPSCQTHRRHAVSSIYWRL